MAKKRPGESYASYAAKLHAIARDAVEGMAWNRIAQKYGYASADSARLTICHGTHRAEWLKAFEDAMAEHAKTMEAEALLTQRQLLSPIKPVYTAAGEPMKDADSGRPVFAEREETVRQRAAHSVLNHCRQLAGLRLRLEHTGPEGGPMLFTLAELKAAQREAEKAPAGEIARRVAGLLTAGGSK